MPLIFREIGALLVSCLVNADGLFVLSPVAGVKGRTGA